MRNYVTRNKRFQSANATLVTVGYGVASLPSFPDSTYLQIVNQLLLICLGTVVQR